MKGRTVTALSVMAVAALCLTACTSHPSTTTPRTAATPRSTGLTSSTPSTTLPAVALCPTDHLTVSLRGSSGAAGTIELTVAVRNGSAATCLVNGYVTPLLLDSSGATLPTTVVRGGEYSFTDFAPAPVQLASGATAYFNLGYSDVPVGTQPCPSAALLELVFPGSADHQTLTETLAPCDQGTVVISPLFGESSPETQTTAPGAP